MKKLNFITIVFAFVYSLVFITSPVISSAVDINSIVGGQPAEKSENDRKCVCRESGSKDPVDVLMGIFTIVTLPLQVLSGRPSSPVLDNYILERAFSGGSKDCYCEPEEQEQPKFEISLKKEDTTQDTQDSQTVATETANATDSDTKQAETKSITDAAENQEQKQQEAEYTKTDVIQ